MALVKANLKSALQSLFQSPPATTAACADAWASAYASYAATGQSCQGQNPILTGRQSVLSSALASAFAGSNAASTASAFDAALVAFWTGVTFPGTTPGSVTVIGGIGTLTTGLPTMWASNVASSASYSAAAQAHADIFDTFTKTVLVVHAAPSACSATLI